MRLRAIFLVHFSTESVTISADLPIWGILLAHRRNPHASFTQKDTFAAFLWKNVTPSCYVWKYPMRDSARTDSSEQWLVMGQATGFGRRRPFPPPSFLSYFVPEFVFFESGDRELLPSGVRHLPLISAFAWQYEVEVFGCSQSLIALRNIWWPEQKTLRTTGAETAFRQALLQNLDRYIAEHTLP